MAVASGFSRGSGPGVHSAKLICGDSRLHIRRAQSSDYNMSSIIFKAGQAWAFEPAMELETKEATTAPEVVDVEAGDACKVSHLFGYIE